MLGAMNSVAKIAGQIIGFTVFVARNFRAFYAIVLLTLLAKFVTFFSGIVEGDEFIGGNINDGFFYVHDEASVSH